MVNVPPAMLFLLGAVCLLAALLARPAFRFVRRWRNARQRMLVEDILKRILSHSGRAALPTPETIGGALGISQKRLWPTIVEMERRGLLTSREGRLDLTPEGRTWALQIVRAHRLWETWLATEAGVALPHLHEIAERKEHSLSPERIDELEARLGHPPTDPHGDPIPTSGGAMPRTPGTSLAAWPVGRPAEIVHLEDEPVSMFRELNNLGLRPGLSVRVVDSSPEALRVAEGDREFEIAPLLAGNIQVREPLATAGAQNGAVPLCDLPIGAEAEVVRVGPELQGFPRRRLLDLGLTTGARVYAWLDNSFADPRAYRLRGTTIALRRDQARHIWVRPLNGESAKAV